MPTDATALLAILRETCGNGAPNVLRAIDEAGWAVVDGNALALALVAGYESEYQLDDCGRQQAKVQYRELIDGCALRLPDGGEHGEAD